MNNLIYSDLLDNNELEKRVNICKRKHQHTYTNWARNDRIISNKKRGDFLIRKINREKWETIVENQKSSGLSQIRWCKENDMSIHTFRYWVNRLKRNEEDDDKTIWAPVVAAKKPGNDEMSIQLLFGPAKVIVKESFSEKTLEKVIQTLLRYV